MEKIMENKIIKTILACIILFSMLSSYLVPISFADNNAEEENDEYVSITITDLPSVVKSDTNISFGVSTTFTGVQTGFKDVHVYVSSSDTGSEPKALIASSKDHGVPEKNFTELDYGNISTGSQKYDSFVINFPSSSDLNKYNKSFVVTIVGQYRNPQTGLTETLNVSKTINVTVQPKDKVYTFSPEIEVDSNRNEQALRKSFTYNDHSGSYVEYLEDERQLTIKNSKYTSEMELIFTIPYYKYRTGLIIDFSQFYNDGFELKDVNGDDELDSNGANYIEGISGQEVKENEIAYTVKEGKEGNITFTLLKKALSENVEDLFNIDNKTYTYKVKSITGLSETSVQTIGTNSILYNSTKYIKMNANGFNYTCKYNEATDLTEVSKEPAHKEENISYDSGGIYIYIYPNENISGFLKASTSSINIKRFKEGEWNKFKEEGLNFSHTVSFGVYKMTPPKDLYIELGNVNLEYVNENGELKTIILDKDSISVNNFYKDSRTNNVLIQENGSTISELNNENPSWQPEDGNYKFTIKIPNWSMHNLEVWDSGYTVACNFTLPYDKLIEAGLTEDEIRNGIKVYQETKIYSKTDLSSYSTDIYENKNALLLTISDAQPKVSYFNLATGNLDLKYSDLNMKENKTIKIQMNSNEFNNINYDAIVYNINPTFYVKLASDVNNKDFEYLNVSASILDNNYIKISNTYYKVINNALYFIIETEGTYDSSINEGLDINVDFTRRLINPDADSIQKFEVYMITDNEHYYNETDNIYGLSKNDEIPDSIFKSEQSYKITEEASASTKTKIIKANRTYISNLTDDKDKCPEQNSPLVIYGGENIKFAGKIENKFNYNMTNVQLMYRLPVKNNVCVTENAGTSTYNTILEEDFILPDNYIDENPKLTNVTKGEPVSKVSLVNLSNIKVTLNKTELNESEYTIYYSNSDSTDFNVEDYIEYSEGSTDFSNAKTILVVLNRDLQKDEYVELSYTMQMPESETEYGMTGAMFGAKYSYVDDNGATNSTTLDSEAAYVIKGEKSKLVIQKKYEGYENGATPAWLDSLAGVEFKLKANNGTEYVKDVYDNDNDGDTAEDLVVVTGESGLAIVNKIDNGIYEIEEITEVEGYDGLRKNYLAEVEAGKDAYIEVENKIKQITLNIRKKWENTNDVLGTVYFYVRRTSVDSIPQFKSDDQEAIDFIEDIYGGEATNVVKTNDQGVATISVPYGEYEISEAYGTFGWHAEGAITVMTTTQNEQEVEFVNKLSTGSIIINKTVPPTENVEELTFHIKSQGTISYTNKEGEVVSNNIDLNIKLNEDYSGNENINVEISEDRISTKITILNLPLGLYTIEEVDMPKIGEANNEDKYVGVTRVVSLSQNGEEQTLNIINRKKVGYLKIKKTAYIQGETEKEYIGNLSSFQIKVTGTSDYGTEVNKFVSLDEDGNAIIPLEIGTYNVTEVKVDGYDIYYKNSEGNLINSEAGVDVRISFNSVFNRGETTLQEIENVLTGVGYVKVQKTLEGVASAEEVANAGIKFKVTGRNAAGGMVEEEILIDKVENNVAYGISNGILVGGEYELEELDNTVPEYYEGIAPMAITLSTSNTDINPLVINVENTRAKGDLQIITRNRTRRRPFNWNYIQSYTA